MTKPSDPKHAIVDHALAIAERRSWEAVRLHDVAAAAGLDLDAIRIHFREKEDLVDAWFDRADQAMLLDAARVDYLQLATRQRIERSILTWLRALAPHRRVTRQMVAAKLEPGHIHIQVPAVMRISRTVQWVREAAGRDATYLHRALEETALTSIYLATFACWLTDGSPDFRRSRRLLSGLLRLAETVEGAVLGLGAPFARRASGATRAARRPGTAGSA